MGNALDSDPEARGGGGKSYADAPVKRKNDKLIACTGAIFGTLAGLCLILGILALALPLVWTTPVNTQAIDQNSAQTCQNVDPSTATQPHSAAASS